MNRSIVVNALLVVGLGRAVAADEISAELALSNMRQPQPHRIVSGALGAADIGRLRPAGVKHVIDLRTAQERQGLDEAGIATGLGLSYHSIPIEGAHSLTKENAAELDRLLKEAGDEPALVHCGSGNRVGALIALRAAWIGGQPTEAAVAEGKAWGMTSLEETVRRLLKGASDSKVQ